MKFKKKIKKMALVTLQLISFYCFAGWGYIVAFTKVLTMYQMYHTWIRSLSTHLSPPSPIPEIV
jgi:hypothetical protein